MNLKFITIAVKDLEESIKFYSEIMGLKEVKKFSPQEGINIVFLKDEQSGTIELIQYENRPQNNEHIRESMVSIGFQVEDLDKTIYLLKDKGVKIIRGPIEVPSGEKFIFIKDPNGVEIELIQGFNL